MKSVDRAAVVAIRRGMVIAELRRAAGADPLSEIRAQARAILRRARVIALCQQAQEAATLLPRRLL
jgi:hypothetical protein